MARDLILITVDAWRADFVDGYVSALDAWAERTVQFTNCWATAPWTTPALVSVFSGVAADVHEVHHEWSAPPEGGPALATNLAAAGFAVPNLCYLNVLDNYANLGFEAAETPPWPPKSPESETLTSALRTTPSPFFAWYHYKWVHLPYVAAERYRRAAGVPDLDALPAGLREAVCGDEIIAPRDRFPLDPTWRDDLRRLYAACVLEMNDWLATVLAAAPPDTTIVLTADHGEELLDDGHVGHASTAHHAKLHPSILRIPLIVIDPRVAGGPYVVDDRVQGIDLFPTLHALAGVVPPPSAGVDLSHAILDGVPVSAPADRVFRFKSARRGCPTPREEADQFVTGAWDGTRWEVSVGWSESE